MTEPGPAQLPNPGEYDPRQLADRAEAAAAYLREHGHNPTGLLDRHTGAVCAIGAVMATGGAIYYSHELGRWIRDTDAEELDSEEIGRAVIRGVETHLDLTTDGLMRPIALFSDASDAETVAAAFEDYATKTRPDETTGMETP